MYCWDRMTDWTTKIICTRQHPPTTWQLRQCFSIHSRAPSSAPSTNKYYICVPNNLFLITPSSEDLDCPFCRTFWHFSRKQEKFLIQQLELMVLIKWNAQEIGWDQFNFGFQLLFIHLTVAFNYLNECIRLKLVFYLIYLNIERHANGCCFKASYWNALFCGD